MASGIGAREVAGSSMAPMAIAIGEGHPVRRGSRIDLVASLVVALRRERRQGVAPSSEARCPSRAVMGDPLRVRLRGSA